MRTMFLSKYKLPALIFFLTLASLAVQYIPASAAACANPSTDRGSVTTTVNITQAGTYTVWSRIMSGDSLADNSYLLEVDGNNCYTVGDNGAMTPNTWTWIDYQNGSTTSKVSISLSAGSHNLKMIGKEEGVKLDRLLLVSDNCSPTGKGDNCTAYQALTAPLYRLYAPAANYHFWTPSSAERDWLTNVRKDFVLEGATGNVSAASGPGLTPLYRLYALSVNKHFWTTSSAEKDWLSITRGDFNYEGITGYVSQSPGTGLSALFRLYAPSANKHFWTTNSAERDWLVITRGDFTSEGTTGYLGGISGSGVAVSKEAESGSVTAPAVSGSDTNASGGQHVEFTDASVSSCALPNYPDASCTGVPAGTTLTTINDPVYDINTPGAVIQNVQINGCVVVHVANVTIRNSKVVCPDGGIYTENGATNLLIEDTEIHCTGNTGGTAISWRNYTLRRAHVHGCDNNTWAQTDVTIEDSYIYGTVDYDPVRDPHTDGVQIPSGAANITIRHNTIYGNYVNSSNFGNSAITSGRLSDGGTTNILIQENLLAGGGYTLYCTEGGTANNYQVIDNHFSRIFTNSIGGFGISYDCANETISGNVIHETGLPANLD